MFSFKGKKAVVTGSTRGIGRKVADMICALDGQVIYTGTKENDSFKQPNQKYIPLDLSDEASIQEFLTRIGKEGNIDILVNNAGINVIEPIDRISLNHWEKIQKVNLAGAMILMKEISAVMIRKNIRGKILNISSIFGLVSKEKRNSYSASKSGMIGLTRASALDLAAHDILVNALCPGFTETDMTRSILSPEDKKSLEKQIPMRRFAREDEIARAAVFLCSDLNTFMTGQTLVADGGFVVR